MLDYGFSNATFEKSNHAFVQQPTIHFEILSQLLFWKFEYMFKDRFPPFPSPHPMTSEYPYHQKQLLNLDGRYHYWPDSHKYGATNIDNDNTYNNDGYLRKDMIIR